MDTRTLHLALAILGTALLVCLVGIIVLAMQKPPAGIPDVLVATTGLIAGGIVGILVPAKSGPTEV